MALAATVAGLSTLLPSRSARPPATTTEASVPGGKGISARLWQDPLQVAKEANLRQRKEGILQPAETWAQLHAAFWEASGTASAERDAPLVLIACVPDSPYAEDVERRLRDRAALHYALSAEDFFPSESTILHYVLAEPARAPVPTGGVLNLRTAAEASAYPLPFEWFTPLPGKPQRKVLLIWVGDSYLVSRPLRGLAGILSHLKKDGAALDARILGPSSSGKYRQILEEIESVQTDPDALGVLRDTLARTQIYSCKATGAEHLLRTGLPWLKAVPNKSTADAVRDALRQPAPASQFDFIRTVATDEDFCATLRHELRERRIGPHAHIAVLSELDSIYGRNSTKTFLAWTAQQPGHGHIFDYEKPLPKNVHTYTYRAGIDGALPKNALGLEDRETKEKGAAKSEGAMHQEPSEGQSQVDYFRRLAEALVAKNKQLIRDTGEGFEAVAVLGSDIYDKLQILRTLHPRFPGAHFITNGLDARFGHPDEWAETRNLLAAASYPLKAEGADETPPFRDSTQAAVYAAARRALQPASPAASDEWKGRSRLFEIGRRGPVELSTYKNPVKKLGAPRWLPLLTAFAASLLIALLLAREVAVSRERWPRSRWGRIGYCLSKSAIAVPCALLLSGAVTACRYSLQDRNSVEPFAIYDGISIWPGDFLRLLVALLAIHFVLKILWDLHANADKLGDEFALREPADPAPPGDLAPANAPTAAPANTAPPPRPTLLDGVSLLWKKIWPHRELRESGKVDVLALFQRYCGWSAPHLRALRALLMLVLYLGLLAALLSAFPSTSPFLPLRGNAFLGSHITLALAVLGTLYVTFLVVDTTSLNCCFIRDLNRGCTDWKLEPRRLANTPKFAYSRHLSVLEADDCADLLDIHYIARRSSAINRLVYFPFLLIALMVAARWSQTDGYTWPPMLVTVFALNAAWASYCAIRLPIEARGARDTCLRRLRETLFLKRAREAVITNQPKDAKSNSVALAAVIDEIEKLREGAFVGIWDQPLLRAILVPSGGVGLLALWDFLPH